MKIKLISLIQFPNAAFSNGTILAKKCFFFGKKNADISKTKSTLVLNGIFSETKYERVIA